MAKKSLKEKTRYYFDNLMSKGMPSLIGFLAVTSFAIIIIFSLTLWLINLIPGKSLVEIFWLNIFKVLNTGILDGAQPGQLNFFLSFIIALASIFIISLLIGLLTSGIQQKIWDLRKGRSRIIENNHTIILGWSEAIFTIIKSLIEASRNQKKCRIVIMGNKGKVEMEDTLKEKLKIPKNTKIICRQGNPINLNDLKILNIFEAKSIIILETSDSNVIKMLLAIKNSAAGHAEKYPNTVATLNNTANIDSAQIAGEGFANFILNKDFISRLIAHTCHQPGLSLIYHNLLDFKDYEIYSYNIKELYGKTFRDAIFLFEDSSVIGIKSLEIVKLNPAADTVIKENDIIIAISADDVPIHISGLADYNINSEAIINTGETEIRDEKILIMGWNNRAGSVISELKKYISPKSGITLLAKPGLIPEIDDFKKRNVNVLYGDLNDYSFLSSLLDNNFDHIVVLAYQDTDINEADGITLMALLHLRNIAKKKSLHFSLTSEMLDINNRELARIARVNDFIVSENITSLLMAQIAENSMLNPVFNDLLSSEGSEIYLKKAVNYIDIKKPVNFYTVIESALLKHEIAIGYKISGQTECEEKNFGIHINIKKSDLINFSPDDEIIVLAEK